MFNDYSWENYCAECKARAEGIFGVEAQEDPMGSLSRGQPGYIQYQKTFYFNEILIVCEGSYTESAPLYIRIRSRDEINTTNFYTAIDPTIDSVGFFTADSITVSELPPRPAMSKAIEDLERRSDTLLLVMT